MKQLVLEELRQALLVVERSLSQESDFSSRASVLEYLEIHLFDRIQTLLEREPLVPELQRVQELKAKATRLQAQLEAENARVVQRLQGLIQSGECGPALRAEFEAQAGRPGVPGGYDDLDLLVSAVLSIGVPAEERAVREPDMVFYQPTPSRAILSLLDRARLRKGDTLVDLGSGLGHVVILAALFTEAAAHGVEFEPAYGEYASRCASHLKVPASFVQADARTASLARGTVFFMYTPFRGAMLQQVLARLHEQAMKRRIRICTFGPCTAEVARTPWLKQEGPPVGENEVALFDSVQTDAWAVVGAIQD